jgi:hypothetical protein
MGVFTGLREGLLSERRDVFLGALRDVVGDNFPPIPFVPTFALLLIGIGSPSGSCGERAGVRVVAFGWLGFHFFSILTSS